MDVEEMLPRGPTTPPVIPPFDQVIEMGANEAGFDIGWPFSSDRRVRRIDAPEGSSILLQGRGRGLTHIGLNEILDNATIQIGNLKNCHVTVRGATIWNARSKAAHFGLGEAGYLGSLYVHFIDCEIVSRRDSTPPTSVWGLFGSNCYVHYERVTFKGSFLAEHDSYVHNPLGAYVKDCNLLASGSEGLKFTNRAWEGAPAPEGALIYIKNVRAANWREPWAWRGGAGIVIQGAQCNVLIEDSILRADLEDAQTLMIDDGGDDRPADGGFPNGWLLVRRCALIGGTGTENLPPMVRIGSLYLGSSLSVVKAAKFQDCGIYGVNVSMQFGPGAIPSGRLEVSGCNTPAIKQAVLGLGLPDRPEARILMPDRTIPVSEGFRA